MLVTVASVLAGLVGAGIIVIGVNGFRAPHLATGFGIPGTPAGDPVFRSWLTVKAVRDIASGVFVFVLLAAAGPHVLGWFMLAAAGIPAGDAAIVLRSRGPRVIAYAVHGATAVLMLAIGAMLLAA